MAGCGDGDGEGARAGTAPAGCGVLQGRGEAGSGCQRRGWKARQVSRRETDAVEIQSRTTAA